MSPHGPNPYAPPQAPIARSHGSLAGTGTCPQCQSQDTYRPSFTWWGGLLGPKLFNHTICRGCGLGFNWKTGKSNATAIGIYFGVGIALAIVIVVLRAS
ncbi:MAG TPA: hypothetical protein VIF15_04560 [Polyangiaceae bacterium]